MTNISSVLIGAFQELLGQMVSWVPKIVVALVIWWVGKYFLNLANKWIKKIDIPGTKIDNKLINKFGQILITAGKVLLFLIVLDYLGIGRTIIGAFVNGLTLAIAIALGIAFGKALEPEAKKAVSTIRESFKQ